ncbi:hypothetical protein ABPG77_009948 [Micractinium sp. CCAP 211/92]
MRQGPIEFFVALAHSRAAFDSLIGDKRLERTLVASLLPGLPAVGTPLQSAVLEFFHLARTHRPAYLGGRGGHDFDWLLDAGFKVLGEDLVNQCFNSVLDGLLQGAAYSAQPPKNNIFIVQAQPLKAARLLRCFVCDVHWEGADTWTQDFQSEIEETSRGNGVEMARCLRGVLDVLY